MKLTNKIKWIAALSVLAVGIPTASGAFAFPAQHLVTASTAAVTQQASPDVNGAARDNLHNQGEMGTHNPAEVHNSTDIKNSSAPALTHNSQTGTHMQATQTKSSGNQGKIAQTPNENHMHNRGAVLSEHGGHGMGGHE